MLRKIWSMNFKIIFYLIYIFWRKFFVKGDFLALGFIVFIFTFSIIGIFKTYEDNYYFLFLFFFIPLTHHLQRKDFSLLKSLSKWRFIVFLEYFFNNIFIFIIFCIKKDFLNAFLCVLFLIFLIFLPQKRLKISLPFLLFNPFWIISFRKYKLIFTFPLFLFLIGIAKVYNNPNLALFSLFLLSFLATIPYFEREYIAHVVFSDFKGEKFLYKQIFYGFLNYIILSFPFSVFVLILLGWEIALFSLLFFIFPLLGVLSKYTFFENPLLQSIFYISILLGYSLGLPLISLPFLYWKSIKKIKRIQNVTD